MLKDGPAANALAATVRTCAIEMGAHATGRPQGCVLSLDGSSNRRSALPAAEHVAHMTEQRAGKNRNGEQK